MLIFTNLVFKLDRTTEAPIGFGDIKYISVIGLFLGFGMQIIILPITMIIAGIGCLIHKYKQIPLGYYLSIATTMSIIFNSHLTELIELITIH